ncbi:Acylglycerol kinase, mitochondrial [Chionoecetes opilio]|uniref:Acylglycerol kinase, mitochondrial n=1 Tax=Chionoecetes opilio TaxID=41210 RepID=A0A8J5CD90_CHIOP|nr:Acylglycerol kinase, mitochondrial [Chionoecetes opilio]
MSRLVRIFQTLRTHKKKSVVFSAVLGAGLNYAKDKYEESVMMRQLCEEAMSYGEVQRPLGEADRHITVLLNPAAQDGKSKAAFDKYCAPLLHLAGLKVAVVRTEHEGQARELMAVMEKTSAVVVAGGDGTLAEVLTGLLRRPDHREASRRFPIGILPLGYTNSAAATVWGFTGGSKPRHLAEATMAIVRDVRRPLDVMEITPQKPGQEAPAKPVFAASEVVWGALRDAATRKDNYWYWPGLKKYMTYVFSSYKDLAWDCSAEVDYTLPCSGCSKCHAKNQLEAQTPDPNAPRPMRRWWMNYLPRTKPVMGQQKEGEDEPDYSLITNDACGQQHHLSLGRVCELTVATGNTPHATDTPSYALTLRTGLEDIGVVDFIQEGWSREWSGVRQYVEERLIGQLSITPTAPSTTAKGEERELNIDSENFEVRAMTLRPRPRAVTIFGPPRPPLVQAAT